MLPSLRLQSWVRILETMSSGWKLDPRGFSSEGGLKTLSTPTLQAMSKGRAGEGDDVVRLAKTEVKRRAHGEQVAERCPLWALSPFEQALHRAKGAQLKQSGSYYALP